MGQSINVILYGCVVPDGVNTGDLRETWEEHIGAKVEAFRKRLSVSANERTRVHAWSIAEQAYVPETPCPDDADPDDLIGFYVCHGDNDGAEAHRFATQAQRDKAIKRCRRRWSRFARWARAQGVEFGKPREHHTRTEVA